MSDAISQIRLPHLLSNEEGFVVPSAPLTGDQFAVRQIEFIQHLFGYRAYLHERSREQPTLEAFLPVFVMLLEALELNTPSDALACVRQLQQVMRVIFPELKLDQPGGAHSVQPATGSSAG